MENMTHEERETQLNAQIKQNETGKIRESDRKGKNDRKRRRDH
jgi:hypothetical protein